MIALIVLVCQQLLLSMLCDIKLCMVLQFILTACVSIYCAEEKKQVQVAAILEMPYAEYEDNRNSVREVMVALMSAANLELVNMESSEYSTSQ